MQGAGLWLYTYIYVYILTFLHFYFLSVLRYKDIEPLVLNGSFYKTVFMFGRKRGSSSIYHLRYKYIIPSVLIFIFKTTRLIYFFSDPNMKSFWFNEDEIHRRRNRLRWLRIYWSRRLDIDYRGVTRLSPTRSQRNGPTSDLTQRRMNSEVYPTLLRTPSMPPPLPSSQRDHTSYI